MEPLTIDLRTLDVGARAGSHDEMVRSIVMQTEEGWNDGADIVVFPEYAWMLLEQFVTGDDKVRAVARLFWESLWPELQLKLSRPDKAVVLGTVPCLLPDGTLRNRAPILCGGRVLFQDKINLTPWERVFSAGNTIQLWQFKGARFAVLVCLDIEVPELAAALRGRGIDAILVPSATESLMGLERIGRCASARSVELCCHVGVSHLTGTAHSELVDKNVGRAAWFTPSQAAFEKDARTLATEPVWSGSGRQVCRMDLERLARSRSVRMETNPALLAPGFTQNLLVESVKIL